MESPVTQQGKKPVRSLPTHAWWLVLGIVGLDYFSTLAYLPSLAAESAHQAAPLAALGVVVITLLVALPLYFYVVGRSPHGEGATGLLERHLHGWSGKLIILVLLGFVATDFIMTRTVSLADAARHLTQNPHWHGGAEFVAEQRDLLRDFLPDAVVDYCTEQLLVAVLLSVLSFGLYFFLVRGFSRSFVIVAALIVLLYLGLTGFLVGSGLVYLLRHSELLTAWADGIGGPLRFQPTSEQVLGLVVLAVIYFPQAALGLSGFELSMASAPLVRGNPGDSAEHPRGRIRNARKLLVAAALIMSLFLPTSVLVVTLLVPPDTLARSSPEGKVDPQTIRGDLLEQGIEENDPFAAPGGRGRRQETPAVPARPKAPPRTDVARQRALAYLAHGGQLRDRNPGSQLHPWLGPTFGSLYDVSTILILCLAGASVAISLREVVPHYLARFGMQLEWASRVNVIVHLFNVFILLVTVVFQASVSAQQWAYATSMLVLLLSAALAVLLDVRQRWSRPWRRFLLLPPLLVAVCFFLVMIVRTLTHNPDGLGIALSLVLLVVVTGFLSRWQRSTELRFGGFRFADEASQQRWEAIRQLDFQVLVPHNRSHQSLADKEQEIRRRHRLGADVPIIFIEALLGDPSDFYHQPLMQIVREDDREIIRVSRCSSIAHVLAAIALEFRHIGQPPEVHFAWSSESPLAANLHFLLLGEGNIPWMVYSLIQKAERDPLRQPRVVIG